MIERTLNIFYRHVHMKADATSRDPNKVRPDWFSHESCFNNLLRTIAADPMGSKVRLTVMYDGTLDDFKEDFMARYYAANEGMIKIQFISAGSDKYSAQITNTFMHQSPLGPHDIVYTLENDYLHQHGWVTKVFNLFNSGLPVDYVSLYDHKDKYFLDMYRDLTCKIVLSEDHHWRTAPSTCGSFMMERRTLERDFPMFVSGLADYFLFSTLVGEQGKVMLTPIPGLSTHSMTGYLSPNVDWAALA